jgi:RND family efflux transporter MFP subunit
MSPERRTWFLWSGLLLFGAVVAIYASGLLRHGRVYPGRAPDIVGLPAPARTATAERGSVPAVEQAVGTVRSRQRVAIAAQVFARVLSVGPTVGDRVSAGTVLVTLDDSDFAASYGRAKAQYERVRGFLARGAATAEQMETAEAAYRQAKAAIDHTRIVAPTDGVIAERHIEPGDLASPGRPLLVLLDPGALRLEAQVREGLIAHIALGGTLEVGLPAARTSVRGTVGEIFPSADPQSRTFEVRVNFEPAAGVHPGMFGRLLIPVGDREVVRVPAAAIERTGQLESVLVQRDGVWTRRLVTTGGVLADGSLEVLSGLEGGETIGLPAA